MTGPTTNPFKKAFACAAIAFVAIYAGLWLSIGPPVDPGRIAGMVLGLAVAPAIIVGLWARKSKKTWSPFRVIASCFWFYVPYSTLSAQRAIRSIEVRPEFSASVRPSS